MKKQASIPTCFLFQRKHGKVTLKAGLFLDSGGSNVATFNSSFEDFRSCFGLF